MRCDNVKDAGEVTADTVTTTDRFGTLTLHLSSPHAHCFPALESREWSVVAPDMHL